jgi:hypothetical protein
MLITKVIEAGIKWLLSLLIPGAGFIKAIMAIKDIVVFFVETAIMLIPAITEAILALASGSVAGVAKAFEFGLSKLIVLVIGLFAKLIGLGDLAKRVQKIFKKIRKRVDKVVRDLFKKAKRAGRKLMRKLGIGKKKKGSKPENDTRSQAEMKKDLDLGVQEGTKFISSGKHSKKEVDKKLKKIEAKYLLEDLKLVSSGKDKFHIHGKVNPEKDGVEIVEVDELIRDDFADEKRPIDESDQLYSLFRAMNLEEIDVLRKEKKLGIRTHDKDNKKRKIKKGNPKGQPFLATDAEYSKKLMKRKGEEGIEKNDKSIQEMYEYLVQIDFVKGTKEVLEDPKTARVEQGDHHTRNEFRKHDVRKKDEKGIVVLKLEPKKETGKEKVLNYGITPKNWEITDPLQIVNSRIARIRIIAKLVKMK